MEGKEINNSGMGLTELRDEELMKAYQLGDEGAFEVLYTRHSPKVFGFLKKRVIKQDIAEDLFQAVFLKLHKSRSTYNSTLPFLPWLFALVQSVMVDGIRSKKRIQEVVYSTIPEKAATECGGESVGLQGLHGLSALSDAQRKAIQLRYEKELSFDEISSELKTSPSNVRQLISRGIRRLKEMGGKQ